MKVFKVFLLFLAAAFSTFALVGCYAYGAYTQTIKLDERVKSNWAQVENQLQRRFDLIPNLVETVKGFAAQEESVFLGVAEARKAYTSAQGVGEKAKAASLVESALSRLLVIREAYPELKSNENFMRLQDSLEGTENRLSVERMRFNDAVRDLNAYIRGPIGRIVANWAKVQQAEYFAVAEEAKETPKVSFDKPAKEPAAATP